MASEERETAMMHMLVRELGGHSVTIVRDGQRLIGWCTGKSHNSIAMADIFALAQDQAEEGEREMLAALEPFGEAADQIEKTYGEDVPDHQYQFPPLVMRDFRAARTAITNAEARHVGAK